jgi:O-antigen/teichoic acid export membrane protein
MAALQLYIRHVFLLVGPVVILYCFLLAILARPILNVLVGGNFDEFADLLPIFIAAYLVTEIPFAIEIGLRACHITDVLFRASLIPAVGAWILGPPLILLFGLSGLLWLGLTLAPFAGALLWLRYQREMRSAEGIPMTEAIDTA